MQGFANGANFELDWPAVKHLPCGVKTPTTMPTTVRRATRRKFLLGLGAALAAPALARLSFQPLRAQEAGLAADGRTNDLPTLQKMLADIERKGQGTIKLPPGRILLSPAGKGSALVLPAKTRLEGSGVDQTTLVMADGAGAGHVINA